MPSLADSLVGRERDLAFLEAFADQARADRAAVLATADAGVGKTALVNRVALTRGDGACGCSGRPEPVRRRVELRRA